MMTEKDYKAIADAIRMTIPPSETYKADLIEELIAHFYITNPLFSADKFREACETADSWKWYAEGLKA